MFKNTFSNGTLPEAVSDLWQILFDFGDYKFCLETENNRVKAWSKIRKADKPNFCNIIFFVFVKIGSVVLVDWQTKLASPKKKIKSPKISYICDN